MYQFSIVIPTWNNLPHLQLMIESLRKNSHFKNQIIVFVNEGKDGTADWLKEQSDVEFLVAKQNVGICVAVNSCRTLVKSSYIVYFNDDMYVCPDWDQAIHNEIKKIGHDKFILSSTLIEPYPVDNPSYVSIVKNFGDGIATFKEKELLESYKSLDKEDWYGSSWPPTTVSTAVWDIVGGYSIEFSPGMYSDPDFSMKLWKYGVRIFKGVGASKIYHFQSKSTNRVKKNRGNAMFMLKWGMSVRDFYNKFLFMGQPYRDELKDQEQTEDFLGKVKKAYKAFRS
jgi:glycosyltransferase involved in cell wall biosynthesis